MREIQVLHGEILRAHGEQSIPLSEMLVLAPDIKVYAPLVEFVFSDIPYRLSGIDPLAKSPYWQGIQRLLAVASSRWEVDRLLELFENYSCVKIIP